MIIDPGRPRVAGRTIEGYVGYYVSADGTVFSSKSGSLRKLKQQRDTNGYLHVVLSNNGQLRTYKVATLVALHFIGPRSEGQVICHNDGDKSNNAVTNLRYDTQRNNIGDIKLHGTENPPQGSRNGMAKLTEEQVLEMRRLRVAERLTHKAIGARFGVSREQARDIINRKFWKHV